MNFDKLNEIIAKDTGLKFCSVCGTPFKANTSRQRCCGAPECQRAQHNEYLRNRRKRLMEEDADKFRAYRRDAMRKYRGKQRKKQESLENLNEAIKRYEAQENFDKYIEEHGLEYGKLQAEKTLAQVPKIDVNIENAKHKEEDNGKI